MNVPIRRSARSSVLKTALATIFVMAPAFVGPAFADDGGAAASESSGGSSGAQRPLALSFELGGHGFLYSLNADYQLGNFALGAGIGYATNLDFIFVEFRRFLVVPAYVNYYFLTGTNRPYLTAGATLTGVSVASGSFFDAFGVDDTASEMEYIVIGTAGGGYELRTRGGFLFRAAGLFGFAQGEYVVYAGLNFGYAF